MENFSDILFAFFDMRETAVEVLRGVAPLLALGWAFSFLPWNRKAAPAPPGALGRFLRGGILVFIGLTLFLQGVKQGFLPAGNALGVFLSGWANGWALIPVGFLLGFAVCSAEPAVGVLANQVEEVTSGAIPRNLIIITLCVGVSCAMALAMARLLFGWPILWIILPGYAAALVLSRFCNPLFAGIAYDSSTVVTGPMVSTFLMSIALGAAQSLEGRDIMQDGFGMVAIVAMVPVVAVMAIGCFHELRRKKNVS